MLAEYIKQYGLVTEQDHIDCLKLALREALIHIAAGKKICVLSHNLPKGQQSQQLMSCALYALIVEVAGPDSARLIMHASKTEMNLKEDIKQMAEKDELQVEDYHFVLIDDAAYTGAQFNSILEGLLRALKGLVPAPETNVDAYLAFDKYNMQLPKMRGVNAKTIRTTPPPIPVEQIQFLYDYIFDTNNRNKEQTVRVP